MAEKIRQYLINGKELMPAYDINEALLQWHIKFKTEVFEIMPVTIEEDKKQVSVVSDNKQVHVKPNPPKSQLIKEGHDPIKK